MKKQYLEQRDQRGEKIRLLLLGCPGVLRGTYGVGQVSELDRRGLNHVFDVAVGVSTGAPTIAYTLAEQKRHSIYWKEAASKDFISLRRAVFLKGPLVDVEYICRVFEDIDQDAVRRSRTNFYVGATCARTGRSLLFDTREHDIVSLIRASIALPGIGIGPVSIADESCLDGCGAMTFPVQQVIEQFRPTDLLVLANRPVDGSWSSSLERLLVRNYPEAVRKTFIERGNRAQHELDFLRTQQECRYGILWSDAQVAPFERDSKKIEEAALCAQQHFFELLDSV